MGRGFSNAALDAQQAAQAAQAAQEAQQAATYKQESAITPTQRQQISGWTGVSSNNDPYGVSHIGYNLAPGASAKDLLSLNGPQINQVTPPTGPSVYENSSPATANPYGVQQASDSAWTAQQGTISQQNMNAQGAQAAPTDGSSYPAYPNQYNLGGGLGGAQPAAPQPASSYSPNQGVTVNVPDTTSRGFNPWSLQGESNARDTTKGVVSSGQNYGNAY